jgi:hypothetical protein
MAEQESITAASIPCCPPLKSEPCCDILDFHYRQVYNVIARDRRVPVEVTIRVRFERCSGDMVLGDLAYSTTLLPGEKVRLFTTDRRSRFTFDSASKLSYRNEQTSEEHFYTSSMSDFMSDLNVRDSGRSQNTNKGHFDSHGEPSAWYETIFSSPSVDVSGNWNSESTSEFLRELSQHTQASSRRSEMGARASSSVSIGEVQTRVHTEGESQDHFESSSREFSNPNHCHAITFFFYRINKMQTVKFTLESIDRRVIDPAVDTKVTNNPFTSRGDIAVIPAGVLATADKRLEVEAVGRNSHIAEQQAFSGQAAAGRFTTAAFVAAQPQEPLDPAVRKEALKQVDTQLANAGLLDKPGGQVSPEAQRQFNFETQFCLPTPGLLVKGCLDECSICEPSLVQEIQLELERKKLENALLQRQIDLLDQAQEYRCCPEGIVPEP